MALTRAASMRLARPSTAFCSCTAVGIRRSLAATSGGKAGYPPNPTTAPGRTSPSSLNAAAMPRRSIQLVLAAAERGAPRKGGGGNAIDGARREIGSVAVPAHVRDEVDGNRAPPELLRQRKRREEMSSRPAGGKHDRSRAHERPIPIRWPIAVSGCRPGHEFRLFDARRIGPAPGHRQQHAHCQANRKHGGAAAGDEGQGHALGRHEPDVDRHVDDRLQDEEQGQPGRGQRRKSPDCACGARAPAPPPGRTGQGAPGRRARRTPRRSPRR